MEMGASASQPTSCKRYSMGSRKVESSLGPATSSASHAHGMGNGKSSGRLASPPLHSNVQNLDIMNLFSYIDSRDDQRESGKLTEGHNAMATQSSVFPNNREYARCNTGTYSSRSSSKGQSSQKIFRTECNKSSKVRQKQKLSATELGSTHQGRVYESNRAREKFTHRQTDQFAQTSFDGKNFQSSEPLNIWDVASPMSKLSSKSSESSMNNSTTQSRSQSSSRSSLPNSINDDEFFDPPNFSSNHLTHDKTGNRNSTSSVDSTFHVETGLYETRTVEDGSPFPSPSPPESSVSQLHKDIDGHDERKQYYGSSDISYYSPEQNVPCLSGLGYDYLCDSTSGSCDNPMVVNDPPLTVDSSVGGIRENGEYVGYDGPIFCRRFEFLTHYALLNLQSELDNLEQQVLSINEQLSSVETEHGSRKRVVRVGNCGETIDEMEDIGNVNSSELQAQRATLLEQTIGKLKQYDRMIAYYQRINDRRVIPKNMLQTLTFRRWLSGTFPSYIVNKGFLNQFHDLMRVEMTDESKRNYEACENGNSGNGNDEVKMASLMKKYEQLFECPGYGSHHCSNQHVRNAKTTRCWIDNTTQQLFSKFWANQKTCTMTGMLVTYVSMMIAVLLCVNIVTTSIFFFIALRRLSQSTSFAYISIVMLISIAGIYTFKFHSSTMIQHEDIKLRSSGAGIVKEIVRSNPVIPTC